MAREKRFNAEDHRYDIDTDGCKCGGHIVYFEDGDRYGLRGDGCEVANVVFKVEERIVATLEQTALGEDYLIDINLGAPALEVWMAYREDRESEKAKETF